jgi:hypothetical protein
LFTSEYYQNSTRDSTCVEFDYLNEKQIGVVKTYLRSANCACAECTCECELFAVIQKLEVQEYFETLLLSVPVPNIHRYKEVDLIVIVPVSSLNRVCVKMEVGGQLYVAKRCNLKEIE